MAGRKPNLFILGAPKCGTSSLYRWLDTHPEACMSRPKEPHFFHPKIASPCRTLAEYEQCFSHALPGHKVLGEASTHMFYSGKAIQDVLDYQPEAKFIVCLRDPVEMAVSAHNMLVFHGAQPRRNFLEAWDSEDEIWVWFVQRAYRSGEVYRDWCALGTHYANLRRRVPAGRLFTLVLDDFVEDSFLQLTRLAEFLEIDCHTALFPHRNSAKQPKSVLTNRTAFRLYLWKERLGIRRSFGLGKRILRLNTARRNRVSRPTLEIHATLAEYFEPEITRLEALLDRDLSHWLDPPGSASRQAKETR